MEASGTLTVPGNKLKAPDRELPWVTNLPAPGANASSCGVLLTHGAGGDHSSGVLPHMAAALAAAGVPVLRFTCKPIHLETRCRAMRAFLEQAATLHESLAGITRWVLAGHSMGGRVAAAVAADTQLADVQVLGCVLSSYPLHPPGKPDQLRDEPLCSLRLPLLFLRGSNDPFSTAGPWQDIQARLQLTGGFQVHTVEGGDHGLKAKGGAAAQQEALQGAMDAVVQFVQSVSAAATAAGAAGASASAKQGAAASGATSTRAATTSAARVTAKSKAAAGPRSPKKAAASAAGRRSGSGIRTNASAATAASRSKRAGRPQAVSGSGGGVQQRASRAGGSSSRSQTTRQATSNKLAPAPEQHNANASKRRTAAGGKSIAMDGTAAGGKRARTASATVPTTAEKGSKARKRR